MGSAEGGCHVERHFCVCIHGDLAGYYDLFFSGSSARPYIERPRHDHAQRVAGDWVRRKRNIHFTPTNAAYFGDEPRASYSESGTTEQGALGLIDDALVFEGEHGYTVNLPFESIGGVVLTPFKVRNNQQVGWTWKTALLVYRELNRRWFVYTWIADNVYGVAGALSEQAGVPIWEANGCVGPATGAVRLTQDFHGQWHRRGEGVFFLAPDRVLFDYRTAIHLSQVRRIDVFLRGGMFTNLIALRKDLLRIEIETPEGARQVVGFEVDDAASFGKQLAQHTQVPFEIHEGRKKKVG